MNKKALVSFSQITILILSLFAFSFIIYSSELVSAGECTINDCIASDGPQPYSSCQCSGYYSDADKSPGQCQWSCPDVGSDNSEKVEDLKNAAIGYATKEGLGWLGKATGITPKQGFFSGIKSFAKLAMKKNVLSYSGQFASKGQIIFGSLAVYATVALVAAFATKYIAQMLGADKIQANEMAILVGASTFLAMSSTLFPAIAISAGLAFPIGIAIAATAYVFVGKKKSADIATYTCYPYVPESGADKCEECNNQKYPCTEYQCNSLGQSCKFIENGEDEYDICVSSNRMDVVPPTITAWQDPLPEDYEYTPITTSSTDRGVKIVNLRDEDGCISPYTMVKFGISLDERATCLISDKRMDSFEEMAKSSEYLSSGARKYNHSTAVFFPSIAEMQEQGIEYDEGLNELFVRCKDSNENANKENFVFKFCVQKYPDVTPPIIVSASIMGAAQEDRIYTPFNLSDVNMSFYTNKPANCKWDRMDVGFENMKNNMSCPQDFSQATPFNNKLLYKCDADLTGIQNYQENDFYVSCQSIISDSAQGQTMVESKKYTIISTRPLQILSANPDQENIKSAGQDVPITISIETASGADNGNAVCFISSPNSNKIKMFNTATTFHTQDLLLEPGQYSYNLTCTDKAGNIAEKTISFTTESDKEPPQISRVYNQDQYLKISTDEPATCAYSVTGCQTEFDNMITLSSENGAMTHYMKWTSDVTLYIKCQDSFKNRPMPGQCQIILRPYENINN